MRNRIILLLATICFGGLLYYLSFETLRVENMQVQLLFGGMFAIYATLAFLFRFRDWKTGLTDLFLAGFVLRLMLVFSTPNLSDDFYRFTWDGYMLTQGYNPFEVTPENYVKKHPEDKVAFELFSANSKNFRSGMNSKRYYSIYPTVNQFVFGFSYWLTNSPNQGNLMIMKIILLLFECFTFVVLVRLLRLMQKATFLALLYWLNPLVVVEFVGNLHFDGAALTLLLFSFYLLKREKLLGSGAALAGAVATKLNPVFLACVNWRDLRFFRLLKWWSIAGVLSVLLLMIVLHPSSIENFFQSFRLYFFVFQFNSSLIFLSRTFFGGEGIQLAMAILPFVTIVSILCLNLLNRKWGTPEKLMLAYTLYFLLGTTVHPWYITLLIPFALLTKWTYPIVWSYVIVWTYGFYHEGAVIQNGWVIFAEYLVMLSFLIWDLRRTYRFHYRS